jgi:hypothetical protein
MLIGLLKVGVLGKRAGHDEFPSYERILRSDDQKLYEQWGEGNIPVPVDAKQ